MRLVFDLEGDNLRFDITRVWCLVGYDIDTDKEYTATDYKEIANILSQADELIGHNIVNYDLPVLKKLGIYTLRPDQKFTDTLILSRLLNPDRKLPKGYTGNGGPHSLEAWGYRCGIVKPVHEDWSYFSKPMLYRCQEDVKINVRVYKHLMKREWGDWDWSFSSYIEHEVARIITEQEDNGFAFNLPLARQRLCELTKRISYLDDQIRTKLSLEVVNKGPVNRPFKKDGSYSKMAEDWLNELVGIQRESAGNSGTSINIVNGTTSSVSKPSYIEVGGDVNEVHEQGEQRSTTRCVNIYNRYYDYRIVGPFTRIRYSEPDLGSRQKLTKQLLRLGWEPENFTDKGNPKLTVDGAPCPSLANIVKEEGKMIAERYILSHRRSQIQGWVDRVRPDGRITAGANPLGTNTGRMRHSGIVNVPKAAKQVVFGREMRELFTVTDCGDGNYLLCGHDADGLELRILGHHMGDMEFIHRLVNGNSEEGTDAHTYNMEVCELDNRDDAKTTIYALIYGAGDAKLGKIKKGAAKEGKRIRELLLAGLPALDALLKRTKLLAKKGYLVGLDGRKLYLRRDPVTGKVLDHKALNTLVQGDGAIVMKLSMIYLNIMVRNRQLNARKVIDQHDESQAEVHKKDVEKYKELSTLSVVKAGKKLNLKCPLKASAKSGKNWSLTH